MVYLLGAVLGLGSLEPYGNERTAEVYGGESARTDPCRRPGCVRRALSRARPRGVQPGLPADGELVCRRGSGLAHVLGSLAETRQDRARWRVAAALAARHRGERVPQYGQIGPPLPAGDEQASAPAP